ncbi:D-Ala-D-Ala carboxypeptidase family metallohydrolase [Bosea sp. AAP35]|uniref:YcbK family protein n=1 Tax=Bosea sp. AAP35 TaxID=1523417 RepID=UPI0006B90B27|nr:D-Ala-D-Ala carboxypeptidase family metallohydrolase [Bosea sp. AAP35]
MRLASVAGIVLALSCVATASAQDGQMMRAPFPPQRPFDLDLLGSPTLPPIVVPPPAEAAEPSPPGATSPMMAEPDEDQGPEWPQLTPGQKAGAEPAFDPNEKPDRPGISTDPGTSTACLPQRLKLILAKISDKYGAVKVTSTWRPLWRARRGSYHRRCEAVDFRVPGVRPRSVMEWVRALPEVGGHKVYWNGILHVDTGPRRPW